MKKLFSFLCLTLVLSIVNAVTPAKVRKVRNSSPYDTLPAKSAKGPVLSKHGRVRYDMMDFVLSQNNDTLSEDKAMNLLDFVSQAEDSLEATSHTQWSVVYNLARKTAMICVNRNYKKQFVFDFDSNNVCIKEK